ncbi:MAG: general secretion pathway protein [Sphingomonadaceae bacterium PASS1]|nr:MAG: general secretion pathway protein [Sphingomonadaceae bacterium PASS1]
MYDQFYGLTGRPFQLTPDPHYYFESITHRKALSYLGYGLAQGEGFIVITGEVGAGKSTLVSHLMQSVDKTRLTAATIVTSHLDGLDLVHMAAAAFGIDTRGLDKASTLKSIENFLHAEARTGRRCLLVVDEAQNLSIDALEELRMLSNFQLGSSALLQIFLLGQPEFRDLVRDAPELEQLRQRVIATHHLEPMHAKEVEPYIIHRLSRAGWNGNPSFTPDSFATLFDETGGMPRKLNTLMNRVMLMGAVEQTTRIDAPLVEAVVADMAGKPFAYEEPLWATREPEMEIVAEIEAALASVAEVEPALDEIKAFTADAKAVEEVGRIETPAFDAEVLISRIAALEQRVSEQDDALRRVLSTMIDWMDKEGNVEARLGHKNEAA